MSRRPADADRHSHYFESRATSNVGATCAPPITSGASGGAGTDLLLIAEGRQDKEVAAVMNITPSTEAHWHSPDGHRFLINSLLQPPTSQPITLVANWEFELKNK